MPAITTLGKPDEKVLCDSMDKTNCSTKISSLSKKFIPFLAFLGFIFGVSITIFVIAIKFFKAVDTVSTELRKNMLYCNERCQKPRIAIDLLGIREVGDTNRKITEKKLPWKVPNKVFFSFSLTPKKLASNIQALFFNPFIQSEPYFFLFSRIFAI